MLQPVHAPVRDVLRCVGSSRRGAGSRGGGHGRAGIHRPCWGSGSGKRKTYLEKCPGRRPYPRPFCRSGAGRKFCFSVDCCMKTLMASTVLRAQLGARDIRRTNVLPHGRHHGHNTPASILSDRNTSMHARHVLRQPQRCIPTAVSLVASLSRSLRTNCWTHQQSRRRVISKLLA